MAKLIDITGKAISGEWGNDDNAGTGIPVLRTTNFTNDGVINYNNVVTREIRKKDLSQKLLQSGDIIIEKSGGSDKQPVGRVVYYDGEPNKFLFNNFTGVLRVRDKAVWYPRYVFYALYSNYAKGGTRRYENKTTGLHNLKTDQYVQDFAIQGRSLEYQQQVVSKLDKVAELIALRKEQLAKLDELVKARFVELFGDVALNPNGYPVKDFEEISVLITDGEHATPRRTEEGIYLLSARNVLNHTLQLDDVDYIDEEEYNRIARRVIPQAGDVLISCSGSIGRCCVVPDGLKFQMVRSAALIRFDDTINPIFAEWLITSDDLQRQIAQSATQSSQANLFQGKIRKLHGYVPPMELQNQFAAFIEQTDKLKFEVKEALEKLETLKKSLMQQYFG